MIGPGYKRFLGRGVKIAGETVDVYDVIDPYTSGGVMRTNIDIDDALLKEAMEVTELSTKKAVVEEALRRLVDNHRRRRAFDELKGMGWEGDLDEMRMGRDVELLP